MEQSQIEMITRLEEMERILRTSQRVNTLSGLIIVIPDVTAQLWRDTLVNVVADLKVNFYFSDV